MDNFMMDIVGEGPATLELALKIAYQSNSPSLLATHYIECKTSLVTHYSAREAFSDERSNAKLWGGAVEVPIVISHHEREEMSEHGTDTLILLWASARNAQKLLFPLSQESVSEYVKGWLGHCGNPGPKPDIDGDCEIGWRVFTGEWGHVAGHSQAIVGIQAAWAMFGK